MGTEPITEQVEKRRASVRKALAKRRANLIADGLCRDCGLLDVEPHKTLCIDCLKARRDRENKRRERLKAA